MDNFSILSLYRLLLRHKLFAALNIGGLAVGIAVLLVLGLYVRFETSYESWLPDNNEIYVIQSIWNMPESPVNGAYPNTMGGLLEQIKEEFPDAVGTRILGGDAGTVIVNNTGISENVAQVDPDFFEVFQLPMIYGNGAGALADPRAAVISEKAAMQYFGQVNAVGKTITIMDEKPSVFRVAGVFRNLPDNSDFKFSVLIPLRDQKENPFWYYWGGTSLSTYLRFSTDDEARKLEEKLPRFVDRRASADLGENASNLLKLALLPLTAQHLTPKGNSSSNLKATLLTISLVGILTLFIAVANYVNLTTAQSGLRAREVAMRKVLGASRIKIMNQFLAEAFMMVSIAALLGLVLTELSLPFINSAGGLSLSINYIIVFPVLFLITVVTTLLSGFYPAVVLSRYRPAEVLAAARSPGDGRSLNRVRETLVVLQFSVAVAFIIATAVFAAQIRHIRKADLGFERSGLATVLSLRESPITPSQKRAFENAVRSLPQVQNVALANIAVGGSGAFSAENVPLPGLPGEGPSLAWAIVGPNYFDVYAPRLLAGRLFDNREADDTTKSKEGQEKNIIVNRSAIAALGFSSAGEAVGKTVGGDRPRQIIGVVDDLRFFSPREPSSPTYYYYRRDAEALDNSVASIRFTGDPQAVKNQIGAIWRQIVPQVPLDIQTADERLLPFLTDDEKAARLFATGAGLAVIIGCVGLWGLASFNTARRVKEIGIRKALGASSVDVVKLLIGQLLRPVLIANLIAWPLAFFAIRKWLAGFADKIELSLTYFIAASLLATIIAVLSVMGHSLRASRTTPAWALHHG